ncbi:MAG: hypothetical protein ACXVGO_17655, partial [Mycobacterium sp.]
TLIKLRNSSNRLSGINPLVASGLDGNILSPLETVLQTTDQTAQLLIVGRSDRVDTQGSGVVD